MVSLNILAFGQLAELIGDDPITMNAADTADLQILLVERFPMLENKKYVIAVNKQVVTGNVLLHEGSTVALLPPFSGG